MATLLSAQTLPQCSCRRIRHRASCVIPRAIISTKQATERAAAVDAPSRQRTGSSGHYVNFTATATDFAGVLARLGASTQPLEAPAAISAAAPELPASPERKAWPGFISGLFGSKQHRNEQMPRSESIQDDSSPFSHAVVMFTATWCGPCSVVYRELKLAAGRLQGRPPTAILVVDVEAEKELASELGIKALPTLLYLGPDESRGPIFTQGPVSASFILDALDRARDFGGRDVQVAKWLKL